jgi:hypothetical protein
MENKTNHLAHAQSCRLWPDPFEAPDVPPADILLRLLKHPGLDPDLEAQIAGSASGRRAIAALRATAAIFGHAGGSKPLRPIVQQITGSACSECAPAFGEIWRTRMVVEHFDGEKIVPRKTWSPPLAFITGEPQNVGFDTVCRAMLCSIREICDPLVAGIDSAVLRLESGHEFVVHFALEYPVSTSQLEICIGAIDPVQAAPLQGKMAAFASGTEADAPAISSDMSARLERLGEFGAWLASNADARLARQNAAALPGRIVAPDRFDPCIEAVRSYHFEDLALAAEGGQRWTNVLIWAGGIDALKPFVTTGDPGGLRARAELIEYPACKDGGEAVGQWRLEPGTAASVPEGAEFFLAQASTGRIMAAGRAGSDGFIDLETGGGFLEIPAADWLLIFPEAKV